TERLHQVGGRGGEHHAAATVELPEQHIERVREPRRIGICTQRFGGLAAWLAYALNVLLGQLDRRGGMMFTTPAADLVETLSRLGDDGQFDKGKCRARGLPEFGGEYPVSALADEIEAPGKGQIRALITFAGNPVLSTPNGRRLEKAIRSLDFVLSIDPMVNETTRLAHAILPPASPLEQSHYDIIFNALAVRNVAKYSPPVFAPPPSVWPDWKILSELTAAIIERQGHPVRAWGLRQTLGRSGPEPLLDLMLRLGPYGARPGQPGLSLKQLEKLPHGLDLGPLEPGLPERLKTPHRRIRLAPEMYGPDLERLAAALHETPPDLVLIGRRQLRTNNSWLHNSERLAKGPNRCTAQMHPADARARGLVDGATVIVRSRVGEIALPLECTDRLMPGVVSIPHGFGHDREGVRLAVARSMAPGVSVNDLTDEQDIDPLSGNAVLNGVPIEVAAAE
ncbi:MAG: molybdopterin oxidoreductase family protein, partial [Myxococcota bacterium]